MSMRNHEKPKGRQSLRIAEQLVADVLPDGWRLSVVLGPKIGGDRPDAVWTIRAPDKRTVRLAVKTKGAISPRDIGQLIEQAQQPGLQTLIVAPYISKHERELIISSNSNYVDTTGNIRIQTTDPAMFIVRSGGDKDPWPSDETLKSLRGASSARALRALLDFEAPFGVRELATRSQTSLGSMSRVIDLLDREGFIARVDATKKSGVAAIEWSNVIRRWAQEYDVMKTNAVGKYLYPRGIAALRTRLCSPQLKMTYAATGSIAAAQFGSETTEPFQTIVPATIAAIYVKDMLAAADELQAVEAGNEANVLLIEPFDNVVFERTHVFGGLTCVTASQLAVDLLTGPGREPTLGEEFLRWMEHSEDIWRN